MYTRVKELFVAGKEIIDKKRSTNLAGAGFCGLKDSETCRSHSGSSKMATTESASSECDGSDSSTSSTNDDDNNNNLIQSVQSEEFHVSV